jgi:hypothetical protein
MSSIKSRSQSGTNFDFEYVQISLSNPDPSLDPSFVSRTTTAPSVIQVLFQSIDEYDLCYSYYSNIHELYYDYIPSFDTINDALSPRSVPSLEPSLDSNVAPSAIHRSAQIIFSISEPSLEPSTASIAATDNDDGPTKAIIFSSCHNLRLPVGTEIFILLLAAPNSKPSAVPSSVPRAIPSM